MTFETVGTDTPATSAMSAIVVGPERGELVPVGAVTSAV
jgi:hypothetical protein